MVNFSILTVEICWRVWGTPANFNGFRVLAALLHGTLVVGVSQTAPLNRGRYLYSAGRPSRWTLAHIYSCIFFEWRAHHGMQWRFYESPCGAVTRCQRAVTPELVKYDCSLRFTTILPCVYNCMRTWRWRRSRLGTTLATQAAYECTSSSHCVHSCCLLVSRVQLA